MNASVSQLTPDRGLIASNVSVSYNGRKVLSDVTLHFETGKITALVGPSGCGKTSFLHSLNRMCDFTHGCEVEGRFRFNGNDIYCRSTDAKLLRRKIGMIFQKPNPFPLSVWKNLELPLKERGITNKSEIAGRIESCMKSVGLWEELKDGLHRHAHQMSGGQQQRLCIARALTMEPEVLLMDEPCSALDPISSGVVEDLIAGFRGKLTVAIVTHNLFQAKRVADQVAMFWVVDGVGTLIESGNCNTMFSQPAHPTTAAYMCGLKG